VLGQSYHDEARHISFFVLKVIKTAEAEAEAEALWLTEFIIAHTAVFKDIALWTSVYRHVTESELT